MDVDEIDLAAPVQEEKILALNQALESSDHDIRIAALKGLVSCGAPISVNTVLDQAASGALRPSRQFSDILRQITAAKPAEAIAALDPRSLPIISTSFQPKARIRSARSN